MNLAFDLSNNKREREDSAFQSYKIVSLWEVLKVKAKDFVEACSILSLMYGHIRYLSVTYPDQRLADQPPFLADSAEQLHGISNKMGLKVVADRSEELHQYLIQNNPIDITLADRMIRQLQEKTIDELGGEFWLKVGEQHSKIYRGQKAFLSKQVLKELPEIKNEAKQAGKCFALEQYTASAFHLMRIMDFLVQRFANIFGIQPDPDRDTWGTILNQTRQEIEKWGKDKKHPNRPYRRKYNDCYKRIDSLRPDRNDLMHNRQNHNEESVRDLKGAVELNIKTFLRLPKLPIIKISA